MYNALHVGLLIFIQIQSQIIKSVSKSQIREIGLDKNRLECLESYFIQIQRQQAPHNDVN